MRSVPDRSVIDGNLGCYRRPPSVGEADRDQDIRRDSEGVTSNAARLGVRGHCGGRIVRHAFAAPAASASCASPANEIEAENCLPGTPAREWDVTGAGSDESRASRPTSASTRARQSTSRSTRRPATIGSTSIGWAGTAARALARSPRSSRRRRCRRSSPLLTRRRHRPRSTAATGPCRRRGPSPRTPTSGIYFAKLVREDGTGGELHVFFIVRDDDGQSDLLFQTSDTTWQAYNRYGGNSLYVGGPGTNPDRASRSATTGPFTTRGTSERGLAVQQRVPDGPLAGAQRLRRLATSRASTPTGCGAEILEHKVFLSVGHDEYWSGGQRANVEAARDAGVEPRVLQRQRDVLEDALGEHRRHRTLRLLQGDARRARRSIPTADVDGHLARRAQLQPADGGAARERAHRARSSPSTPARGRFRCRPRRAGCGSGGTRPRPRLAPGRRRRSATTRSATSGTRISTTARGPPASSGSRRRRPPASRSCRTTVSTYAAGHRDAPPDAVSRRERRRPGRAGLRRRAPCSGRGVSTPTHDRGAAPASRDHAAGDGQPVRRHGRAAGDPAAGPHARPPRPPTRRRRSRGHRRSRRRARPSTQGEPGHDQRHRHRRRRPRRSRRGLRRRRRDMAPGERPRELDATHGRRRAAGETTVLARAADDSGNLGAATQRTVTVVPRSCPCTLFGNAVPGEPAENDSPADRGRDALPRERGRDDHRRALLPGPRLERGPGRQALQRRRPAARGGDVPGDDRRRLAAGAAVDSRSR